MANQPAPDRNDAGLGRWKRFRAWLRRRVLDRKLHWFIVVTCIVVGELLATALERDNAFKWLRNFAFQKFQSLGARKGKSVFDAVVLIDDDTYWKADRWTPRVPISRELLAELVKSVAKCEPKVIAVDIDLSTGDDSTTTVEVPGNDGHPGRKVTLHTRKEWGPETLTFLDAVESALEQRIKVVLTHEVGRERGRREWKRFPNVYDGYTFGRRKPRMGHLLFDTDLRVLPLPVPLSDGKRVKSLAIEAAEAYSPETWASEKWDREVLTRMIDPGRLVTVSARELLPPKDEDAAERICDRLQGKIVWIGGAWHQDGYGRGTRTVDAHATARGDLPGVLLHANYAESLLDEKLLAQGSTWLVEVPLALLIAIWLDRAKWPWKWLVMLLLLASPLGLSYVGIQNFGLYFDVFVISFLLILGVFLETVAGWYLDHRELDRIKREGHHGTPAPAGITQDS
jgi:CHASE2 domain-containing sensor protein